MVGRIKGVHYFIRLVSHHLPVHRTPIGFFGIHAWATFFQIQLPGYSQKTVAYLLGAHALHVGSGKPCVLGVGLLRSPIGVGLPIGGTGDHQSV